jgi:hypothetical protein
MKTQSEAQPVAVIEATDKAELLAEVRQLKKMLEEIISLLKEGCEHVRAEKV